MSVVRFKRPRRLELRQSYRRVGKFALIKHQRYSHAKQFKRANRSLKKLKTYLGRVIRDIRRKTAGNEGLRETFLRPQYLAERVLAQGRHQRGRKIVRHSHGGQFVAHVAALPGNPYDGHTLITIIPAMQAILRNTLDRVIADAGYRGHNAAPEYRFKVYTAGQRRRISPQIKRDMKRARPLSPLSVTSRTTTAWAAIILPIHAAMPSTPCSPPSDTTFASCSDGRGFFCSDS